MNPKEMFKGLSTGMKVLVALGSTVLALYFFAIIALIVMNVTVTSVNDADIVDATTEEKLTNLSNDFSGALDTLLNPVSIILALVIVVVILAVFGFILYKKNKGKGSSSDSVNY